MSPFHQSALMDFGIMSIIMILAHLIRYKVKFLQDIYMPSSIIAGVIALIFGSQFFGWIPFSVNASGQENIVTYPALLVVLLFAGLFMGHRKKKLKIKKTLEHAGDTFFFNLGALLAQYGFALLFGMIVLAYFFPSLPDGFGIMLPAGFIGGYGTAAAMGGFFEENGWVGAATIGYASATVGVLSAILGGIIMINIATRKKWTRLVKNMSEMPQAMRDGFVPADEQESVGAETVHPIALDPITWHMALVIATTAGAFYFNGLFQDLLGSDYKIPEFCLALLLGGAIQRIFEWMGIGQYIDRQLIHRLGSWITDYLVAFGIAAITVKVVVDLAAPLFIMFAFGICLTMTIMWFIGQKISRNFWFERALFMYGWNTGSVATSVVLLRIIDPDMRSQIIEDFGLAYIGISFFEIAIIALLPPLIISGIIVGPMAVLIVGFAVCILLSKYTVGWYKYPRDALREGEADIIAGETEELH